MKVFFTLFLFITLCVMRSTICVNIKRNLGHAYFFRPHTLGKLIY